MISEDCQNFNCLSISYKGPSKNKSLFSWFGIVYKLIFAPQFLNAVGMAIALRLKLGQKQNIIMSKLHFTTKHANAATVQHNWYVVDGTNQTVGRMCSRIAAVLRGKNKAYYTPHVDCGDFVIVTNVDKVKFTGNKLEEKIYDRYSGYPGGRKEEIAKELLKRRPEVVVERAVKGMLPKNRLGRKMYKKLFVYVGDQHPHTAQQPKELKF
jgi:large subunit ribosomal protein L13